MSVFSFEPSQGEKIAGSGKVRRLRILLCKGKNYKIENARDSEIPVLGYNVCENMYIKGRGLSCMANDYQPPNPHPLNLNSPFRTYCELYSLWRFWDFIRWILSYFSAPGLEFNFLSLTYVWWIVEHWSSDLPPLPNAGQHVQAVSKDHAE